MRKILIPIDGTDRSLKAVDLVKEIYNKDTAELTIFMSKENIEELRTQEEFEEIKQKYYEFMQPIVDDLSEFKVGCIVKFGNAGSEILSYAKENDIDIIVMTKSTKTGWTRILGSVATHVVKNASCIVMIVPESHKILHNKMN